MMLMASTFQITLDFTGELLSSGWVVVAILIMTGRRATLGEIRCRIRPGFVPFPCNRHFSRQRVATLVLSPDKRYDAILAEKLKGEMRCPM
jgi:hypothetical protein